MYRRLEFIHEGLLSFSKHSYDKLMVYVPLLTSIKAVLAL